MLKDNQDIILSRKNMYIRVIAQKAIFTLNYYADNESKYRLNDVEDLIEKYIDDPEVLLNMMDLKQNYKYAGTNAENILSRPAIEVLLTKSYDKDYTDQDKQLQYVISFSNLGSSGRNVLKNKLGVYQMTRKIKLMDQEILIEHNLLKAIAQKAKKTLDHLTAEDFSIEEIISMIVLNLSEEKDLYRLLNLHEFYSVSRIGEAHKKLRKDVLLGLIKDQVSLSRAVFFSDPQCGPTGQKELNRILNNIAIAEINKRNIFEKINSCVDIKEFKKTMNIIKDQELLTVLRKYRFLDAAKQRFSEYFEKIKNTEEENMVSSSQYKLRRVFAEIIINDIYDLELLAYYITGRKDVDHLLRVISNCETLTPIYQIKFSDFLDIIYEKLNSGSAVIDVIKKAVLGNEVDESSSEYKEFYEKYAKKYYLNRLIKDIQWNLRKGNIDFNIKTEEEIKEIISIALEKYSPDIYELEKMIGTEVRKNYEEIFEMIVEDDALRAKYEKLERQAEIKMLLEDVKKIESIDLDEMLIKNNLSPEQKNIIENEIQRRTAANTNFEKEIKQEKKETSKLVKECQKIIDVLPADTKMQLTELTEQGNLKKLIEVINSLPLKLKVKIFLKTITDSNFLKILGLDHIFYRDIQAAYMGENSQFKKGHMAVIKKQWGITEQEVRKLGDLFGNHGKKARQ